MFYCFAGLLRRKAGGRAASALGFYAESWNFSLFCGRAFCTVFLDSRFSGNGSAVDMGQVERERAPAEVGAVIIGRVPFAAEVTAGRRGKPSRESSQSAAIAAASA